MKNQDLIKEMQKLILTLKDEQISFMGYMLRAEILDEHDMVKYYEEMSKKIDEKIIKVESKMKALENEG